MKYNDSVFELLRMAAENVFSCSLDAAKTKEDPGTMENGSDKSSP